MSIAVVFVLIIVCGLVGILGTAIAVENKQSVPALCFATILLGAILLAVWSVYASQAPKIYVTKEEFPIETITYANGTQEQFVQFDDGSHQSLTSKYGHLFPKGTKLQRKHYITYCRGIDFCLNGNYDEDIKIPTTIQANH